MSQIETYSDDDGNSITIETASDGVTVSASIRTKTKYTGGSDPAAARAYAQKNGLTMDE